MARALIHGRRPEKAGRAAVRWHGRLETEAPFLSLTESHLGLAELASLCAGDSDAEDLLRRLARRTQPIVPTRRAERHT